MALNLKELISTERAKFTYIGKQDGSSFYMFRYPNGNLVGMTTEESARNGIEIRTAFKVLSILGYDDDDAHETDWHLWCHDAELMVTEIIKRLEEVENSRKEATAWDALVKAVINNFNGLAPRAR